MTELLSKSLTKLLISSLKAPVSIYRYINMHTHTHSWSNCDIILKIWQPVFSMQVFQMLPLSVYFFPLDQKLDLPAEQKKVYRTTQAISDESPICSPVESCGRTTSSCFHSRLSNAIPNYNSVHSTQKCIFMKDYACLLKPLKKNKCLGKVNFT